MAAEAERARLLDEFKEMTGTTDEFAISFLDASDWKLDQAMELFLGGNAPVPSQNAAQLAQSDDEQDDDLQQLMDRLGVDRETAAAIKAAGGGGEAGGEEGVRAPILQKRARLFDTMEQEEDDMGEGYYANGVPGLTGAFDAQLRLARDVMMPGGAAAAMMEPQRPSMFAPPGWMIYRGTFEEARKEAKTKKRWVLINLQDQQEFQSLVLNRDLWSDETVQNVIRESFLFFQQDRSSPEAQRFITLYNPPTPFPHVCIVDPRTGERAKVLKLKKKENDLRETFFEQVTEFLDNNTFERVPKSRPQQTTSSSFSGAASASQSPTPPTEQSAEDKELAAAIQASLKLSQEQAAKSELSKGEISKGTPPDSSKQAKNPLPVPDVSLPTYVPLAPEPAAGADSTTIQFRFPDGSRAKRRFLRSSPVSMLFSFVAQSEKVPSTARFDLLTGDVPPRSLAKDLEKTVVDADVLNQNLIIRINE